MRKLVIQIPCLNEAETLAVALGELPRAVEGFDSVEWLVVDDGSTDGTAAVARAAGARVVSHARNRGLAVAFMTGLDAALRMGADVIVNTDADNQYCAADIPALVSPILAGEAMIVVGARPIAGIAHFSPAKKLLQALGSWAVRVASGTDIPDAPSGFRAMSREAAMRINVVSEYTYTIETIIQAGHKGLAITSIPVRVNGDLRPSRLVRSVPSYVIRSLLTIVRIFVVYRPMRFFTVPAVAFLTLGTAIGCRFLFYYTTGQSSGHVQSLILAAILLIVGFQFGLFAFIAELLSVNRKLVEDVQYHVRRQRYDAEASLVDR